MKKVKHIVLIISVLFGLNGHAQTDCYVQVQEAEMLYFDGEFEKSAKLLDSLLRSCKYPKKDKELVLTTLIQNLIELDRIEEVHIRMEELLKVNPNYEVKTEIVQQDFLKYLNKWKVRPRLSVGGRVGINIPTFNVKRTYTILNGVDYSAKYKGQLVFHGGVMFEYEFINNLSGVVEFIFSQYKYERTLTGNNNWQLKYDERINYFEVPVYIKKYFSFDNSKLEPYLLAGGIFQFPYSATADLNLAFNNFDVLTGTTDQNTLTSLDVDRENEREGFNADLAFGAGLSRKVKNVVFSFDLRYVLGLTNIMEVTNKYDNQDLIFNFYYIDNDVKASKFEFSVSVNYIFNYSIKKQPEK